MRTQCLRDRPAPQNASADPAAYSTNTHRGAEAATPWEGSLFSFFFRRLVRGTLDWPGRSGWACVHYGVAPRSVRPYRDNGLETCKRPLIGRVDWPSVQQRARRTRGALTRSAYLPRLSKSCRKRRPKVRAARIILPGPRRVTVVFPRITLLKVIQRLFRISWDRAVDFSNFFQALRRDPLAAEDRWSRFGLCLFRRRCRMTQRRENESPTANTRKFSKLSIFPTPFSCPFRWSDPEIC